MAGGAGRAGGGGASSGCFARRRRADGQRRRPIGGRRGARLEATWIMFGMCRHSGAVPSAPRGAMAASCPAGGAFASSQNTLRLGTYNAGAQHEDPSAGELKERVEVKFANVLHGDADGLSCSLGGQEGVLLAAGHHQEAPRVECVVSRKRCQRSPQVLVHMSGASCRVGREGLLQIWQASGTVMALIGMARA